MVVKSSPRGLEMVRIYFRLTAQGEQTENGYKWR